MKSYIFRDGEMFIWASSLLLIAKATNSKHWDGLLGSTTSLTPREVRSVPAVPIGFNRVQTSQGAFPPQITWLIEIAILLYYKGQCLLDLVD